MVSLEWIDKQLGYLTLHLGPYRTEATKDFFFEPSPGFYGFIAQGRTDALNEAMRMLAEHIESPSTPTVEDWKGPKDPLATLAHDWGSDDEPPGLIRYIGPHRSRIQIGITNKHSPLVLGAILAHELTHHYLANKGIRYSDVAENERLTDFATTYLGLGKLTLNGYEPISWTIHRPGRSVMYTYRVGYLSSSEMATIIAALCTFRHIPIEIVHENLSPHASKLLSRTHASVVRHEKKKQARAAREERRRIRKEKILAALKGFLPWFHDEGGKQSTDQIAQSPPPVVGQSVVLTCGACGKRMRVPAGMRKLRVKCPGCNKDFLLHSPNQ